MRSVVHCHYIVAQREYEVDKPRLHTGPRAPKSLRPMVAGRCRGFEDLPLDVTSPEPFRLATAANRVCSGDH